MLLCPGVCELQVLRFFGGGCRLLPAHHPHHHDQGCGGGSEGGSSFNACCQPVPLSQGDKRQSALAGACQVPAQTGYLCWTGGGGPRPTSAPHWRCRSHSRRRLGHRLCCCCCSTVRWRVRCLVPMQIACVGVKQQSLLPCPTSCDGVVRPTRHTRTHAPRCHPHHTTPHQLWQQCGLDPQYAHTVHGPCSGELPLGGA